MSQDLIASIEYIEKEKGVSREALTEAIRHALLSACRKSFPEKGEVFEVQIDPNTFSIKLLSEGKEIHDARFGRIAAQTAKQVIIQKLREAERESIYSEYSHKQGDIVSGSVHRIEKKAIIVDFGKTEGILPVREQSPVDDFRQGHIVRAFVTEVKKTPKGTEVILSRSHPDLVTKFFEMEVPEIHDGVVKIMGVAREAGSRTKIAVTSSDEKIDSVGSCVGVRGQRVKNIVRELNGEKIDIIPYSDDLATYIKNAMAPAELKEIKMDFTNKRAEILVADDQLSLAIGKRGQNVRLASKLIGWELDVRSKSQMIPLSELDGVGEKTEEALKKAGIKSIRDLSKVKVEDLAKLEGIGEKTAVKILESARKLMTEKTEATEISEKAPEKKETSQEEQAKQVSPETEGSGPGVTGEAGEAHG